MTQIFEIFYVIKETVSKEEVAKWCNKPFDETTKEDAQKYAEYKQLLMTKVKLADCEIRIADITKL